MASQIRRIPLLMLVAAVLAFSLAEAQQNIPSCAAKLVPCASYMNSTKPPPSCCDPIKEAVATDRKCLCNLYNTPGLLQSFGINVTQALQLTKSCGVDPNLSMCNGTASASPPKSGTSSTPATSQGGASGNDKNDCVRMAWTGLSSLILLVSATVLLC